MIRNIIWDVDGTLFDTYPSFANSFRQAVKDLGKDAPLDWITQAAKISMDQCVAALSERCELKPEDIEDRFSIHYGKVTPKDQPLFTHVLEICRWIHSQGGKNLIVTHRHEAGLVELLEAHNMRDNFSGWFTADDDYAKKPDPAAFEATIRIHSLDREATLAVGDREIDILAGHAAGLMTCLFTQENPVTIATLTVKSFEELHNWLSLS